MYTTFGVTPSGWPLATWPRWLVYIHTDIYLQFFSDSYRCGRQTCLHTYIYITTLCFCFVHTYVYVPTFILCFIHAYIYLPTFFLYIYLPSFYISSFSISYRRGRPALPGGRSDATRPRSAYIHTYVYILYLHSVSVSYRCGRPALPGGPGIEQISVVMYVYYMSGLTLVGDPEQLTPLD